MNNQQETVGLRHRIKQAVRTFIQKHIVADDPYDNEDVVTALERERAERLGSVGG